MQLYISIRRQWTENRAYVTYSEKVRTLLYQTQ